MEKEGWGSWQMTLDGVEMVTGYTVHGMFCMKSSLESPTSDKRET